MSLMDVLHDPTIFPEPHAFKPERWLEAAERGERLDKYLVAFSKGKRSTSGLSETADLAGTGSVLVILLTQMKPQGLEPASG
jgi:hypothetical protein